MVFRNAFLGTIPAWGYLATYYLLRIQLEYTSSLLLLAFLYLAISFLTTLLFSSSPSSRNKTREDLFDQAKRLGLFLTKTAHGTTFLLSLHLALTSPSSVNTTSHLWPQVAILGISLAAYPLNTDLLCGY